MVELRSIRDLSRLMFYAANVIHEYHLFGSPNLAVHSSLEEAYKVIRKNTDRICELAFEFDIQDLTFITTNYDSHIKQLTTYSNYMVRAKISSICDLLVVVRKALEARNAYFELISAIDDFLSELSQVNYKFKVEFYGKIEKNVVQSKNKKGADMIYAGFADKANIKALDKSKIDAIKKIRNAEVTKADDDLYVAVIGDMLGKAEINDVKKKIEAVVKSKDWEVYVEETSPLVIHIERKA